MGGSPAPRSRRPPGRFLRTRRQFADGFADGVAGAGRLAGRAAAESDIRCAQAGGFGGSDRRRPAGGAALAADAPDRSDPPERRRASLVLARADVAHSVARSSLDRLQYGDGVADRRDFGRRRPLRRCSHAVRAPCDPALHHPTGGRPARNRRSRRRRTRRSRSSISATGRAARPWPRRFVSPRRTPGRHSTSRWDR